jgi:hypothetical protein
MDEDAIMEYLGRDETDLRKVLAEDNPPFEALQAAAIADFMQAYHLTDRRDAVRQYAKLRRAQADLLALEGEERDRFMRGLSVDGE